MKIKLSTLKKKIDTEFSLYIRRRDHYKCCTCGLTGSEKDGIMQCGHLFTRSCDSTRWNELNAACQCRGCNYRHEYDWEPMRRWFIRNYGNDWYEALYREHKTVKKYTRGELIELLEHYKKLNKEK